MKLNGKRRKVWWLLAIIVLALAIWGWRVLNAPLPQYQTLVVRKGDLQPVSYTHLTLPTTPYV